MTISSSTRHTFWEAEFQDNRVGYAIGDIHGCADLLELMLERIELMERPAKQRKPKLIFLGDYVDRGPDSRRVLELLSSNRLDAFECIFLLGNHDAAMLSFLNYEPQSEAWLSHGGLDTLISYGVAPPPVGAPQLLVHRAQAEFDRAVPDEHKQFLKQLRLIYISGEYLFVHAGMDPTRCLADNTAHDFLWIRRPFLESKTPLPYRVVHGHTPVTAAQFHPQRIAVDTGAYATGVLTAVRFSGVTTTPIEVRRENSSKDARWFETNDVKMPEPRRYFP
ncbi:MAG: serine/threonine protein phosphatase [Alphaproteobacteria bacterium]|nr:MAG: serine/threonine protein phosphatase [Alphaproteobacteria bacterium]